MRCADPLVIVVMGPSGVGKSVVGALLAARLGWDFAEGDDFHPKANIDKMTAGHPLTDADRGPWLASIAGWIERHVADGNPAVITCSALRRAYRDRLRGQQVRQVLLVADEHTLRRRLQDRPAHFMPATLLQSQLQTLEMPQPGEDVLVIDSVSSPAGTVDAILRGLSLGSTR